jgi:hypothetical protein
MPPLGAVRGVLAHDAARRCTARQDRGDAERRRSGLAACRAQQGTNAIRSDIWYRRGRVAHVASSVAALDTYFAVMAESGISGSSFTARIIASTRASLVCAVLGAWCALTGPLHGGAPGPTLDLLDGWRKRMTSTRGALRLMGPAPAGSCSPNRWSSALQRCWQDQARPQTACQCGDRRRAATRCGGLSPRGVHAGVRRVALCRLAGACNGAAEDRADDPANVALRRTRHRDAVRPCYG